MKTKNTELVAKFYKAWMDKDLKGLKNIYGKEVIFNDPLFSNLNYEKTIKMWTMLFGNSKKKVNASYEIIEEKKDLILSRMEVHYEFGKKKNKVTNIISTHFVVKDNKIVFQMDNFDFRKWANQAFGFKKQKLSITYKILKLLVQMKLRKRLKKFSNVNFSDSY